MVGGCWLLIILVCLLLVKVSDLLLINLSGLARKIGLPQFIMGGFIVAFATSLPEFFVGLNAAVEKQPVIALGNIIGANIANLSLVIGVAAFLGGKLLIRGELLKNDVYMAFLAGALPMLLLLDQKLTRLDGGLLILFYLFYNFLVIKLPKKQNQEPKDSFVWRLWRQLKHRSTQKEVIWLVACFAALFVGGSLIVRLAEKIALTWHFSPLVVGLLIVSLGTTLPELIFELEAIRKKQSTMALGNLLGSIVANATLIIGMVAIISPFTLPDYQRYLLATMAFVVVFGAFYLFVRSKHRLDRWEGAILMVLYLVFALVEIF